MTRVIGKNGDRDVSLWAIDQYFRQVRAGDLSLVSEEEQTALLERVQAGTRSDGSLSLEAQAARDRLVESFQGLVIHLVQRVRSRFRHLDQMDLIQDGNEALLYAIAKYDAGSGFPLRALVVLYVRQAFIAVWHECDGLVRLPHCSQVGYHRVERVRQQLADEYGRDPSAREIARVVGLFEREVCELVGMRLWHEAESLQALAERYELPEEQVYMSSLYEEAAVSASPRAELVRQVLASARLSAAQRQVIELRYGLREDGYASATHEEIAAQVGRRAGSVSSMEQSALKRLRHALAATGAFEVSEEMGPDMLRCLYCGDAFRRAAKMRSFCSPGCRNMARRHGLPGQGEEVA